MTLNEKFHEFVKEESNPNPDKYWEDVFKKMAKYVFQNCHLEANGKKYDFTEIEFYYYGPEHEDPWCYRKSIKDKKSSDTLWFHYSGMDITFDNDKKDENEHEYGGILIRGIKDEKGNSTNGPLRSLYKLLNASANGTSVYLNLKLTQSNIPVSMEEPIEPRYGLNIQKGDKQLTDKNEYKTRKYRFYLEGTKIAKQK